MNDAIVVLGALILNPRATKRRQAKCEVNRRDRYGRHHQNITTGTTMSGRLVASPVVFDHQDEATERCYALEKES